LALERRGAEGHVDRLPQRLAELVASKVDVIITIGYPPALVAKQGTTLPVVVIFAGDPVGTGLSTGGAADVSAEATPKRLELLKQIAPNLRRVALLWNANDLGMTLHYRASEGGAQALGIGVQPLGVREPDDFGQAFEAMKRDMPDAFSTPSQCMGTSRKRHLRLRGVPL
jgi:putative tryptophan/tyrosine transport system substrate-binding protein